MADGNEGHRRFVCPCLVWLLACSLACYCSWDGRTSGRHAERVFDERRAQFLGENDYLSGNVTDVDRGDVLGAASTQVRVCFVCPGGKTGLGEELITL